MSNSPSTLHFVDEVPKTLAVISTGGTIEKTYDAHTGVMSNQLSVLDMLLGSLHLSVNLRRLPLLNKDSTDMDDADFDKIVMTVKRLQADSTVSGVIIVHGTDRLAYTGSLLIKRIETHTCPIVLTGAMRPWEMRDSDAAQNITEALLAAQLLSSGVYVAMQGQVLAFPGVEKDREVFRFRRLADK